jgi:hypothetical protein
MPPKDVSEETISLKIVVFDLDETLGSFKELGVFCDALNSFNLISTETEFVSMLNLFPEFFRPNIFDILHYIHSQKVKGSCYQVMIYTNNQGPPEWVLRLSEYINLQMGHRVFDRIISAFKVKGVPVELSRTTHKKTFDDLIRCTQLPAHTEICFVDDIMYPLMQNENVFYIRIKPYHFHLDFEYMVTRFVDNWSNEKPSLPSHFRKTIVDYMNEHVKIKTLPKRTPDDLQMDIIISKKIMVYLHQFFKDVL